MSRCHLRSTSVSDSVSERLSFRSRRTTHHSRRAELQAPQTRPSSRSDHCSRPVVSSMSSWSSTTIRRLGARTFFSSLVDRITYISTVRNLGFSGGMNVGIRYAL